MGITNLQVCKSVSNTTESNKKYSPRKLGCEGEESVDLEKNSTKLSQRRLKHTLQTKIELANNYENEIRRKSAYEIEKKLLLTYHILTMKYLQINIWKC